MWCMYCVQGRVDLGECKCGVCIVYKGRFYIGECKSGVCILY